MARQFIYKPVILLTVILLTSVWGPDEKSVFVIELNRDQNHAQLVQYDAVSGQKIGVLYEEKHTRYVEPQHPLIFLPWDDSQFIYQTQRDGFNHLYLMDTKIQTER